MAGVEETCGYSLRVKLKKYPVDKPRDRTQVRSYHVDWRRKLKKDKGKYELFKERDARNHRIGRKEMTVDQRVQYNISAKLRMRKYRERKKDEGTDSVHATRKQVTKLREYWREKKKEQRSKMTDEQRKEVNTKKRQNYAVAKRKLAFETPSKDSVKKASERMNIPKKPEVFANVINRLLTNSTPRKKELLKNKGIFVFSPTTKKRHETNARIVASVKLNLKKLKVNQTKRGKQLYYTLTQSLVGRHIVEKQIREALDIKFSYWKRMSLLHEEPIPLLGAMSDDTKASIKTYYETETVNLPTKRSVLKDGTQRSVLTESLNNAYTRYRLHNPGLKVSLSTFKKHRPKEVLTMDKEKFISCLCEYCLNVEFKLAEINRACNFQDMKHLKLKDKYDCIDTSMCEKLSESTDKECYTRNCSDCGVYKIFTHFQALIQRDGEKEVKWKRWALGTMKTAGLEKRRLMLVEKHGKLKDLIREFSDELAPLAAHIFIANWQRKQYSAIVKNVPKRWVVSVADFAENYRCINQDEVQSAYYNYEQSTVFPLIAHYRCPDCDNAIVQESAVFITPDTKHDAEAATQFTRTMDIHLKERINFSHEVQFSDGCASQFKSKKPFQYISEENHTMERCFFGSRHGKSMCDSLGGLVKQQAARFVKSRRGTIHNAEALYEYCKTNLTIDSLEKCTHKRRLFFYTEEIKRNESPTELQTLKGTRTFHDVRGVEPGIVNVRHLSCFCTICTSVEDSRKCENADVVGEWEVHSLSKVQSVRKGRMKNKSECVKRCKRTINKPNRPKRQKKEEMNDVVERKNRTGRCAGVNRETSTVERENIEDLPVNIERQKRKDTSDSVEMQKLEDIAVNEKIEVQSPVVSCSTYLKLKKIAKGMNIERIPEMDSKTFFSTGKVIDNNSLNIVPNDIPLKPNSQLYPATIYGDGNCLPRSASVLAYGHEDNHLEMRERITIELTINEDKYLSNEFMKKGKNPEGDDDVVKAFAHYSSCYIAEKLTKCNIRSIYKKEVLQVRNPGIWMGLWQLASLANILNCPVVSVCPQYGSTNVRKDIHRVFFPFEDLYNSNTAVFIFWTNIHGAIPVKEFSLNHFEVLLPLVEEVHLSVTDSDSELPPSYDDEPVLNEEYTITVMEQQYDSGNDTNTRVLYDEPPTFIFEPVPSDGKLPASDESVLNEESTVTIMEPQYDNCENDFVPNSPVCNDTNTRGLYDEPPTVNFKPVPSDGELPASEEPVLNEESTVTIMEPKYDSCENDFVPNSPVCNDTKTRVLYDEPPTVNFKPVPSDGKLPASDESVLNEESTVNIMEPQYDSCESDFVPNSPVCKDTNTRIPHDETAPSDGKLPASDDPVLNEESTVTVMEPHPVCNDYTNTTVSDDEPEPSDGELPASDDDKPMLKETSTITVKDPQCDSENPFVPISPACKDTNTRVPDDEPPTFNFKPVPSDCKLPASDEPVLNEESTVTIMEPQYDSRENPFVPNSPVCNDTNTRVPDDEPPTVIFKPVPSDESVLNEESTVTIMELQYDSSENPFVPNSPVCNDMNTTVPDNESPIFKFVPVPSDCELQASDEPVLNEESTVTVMEPQCDSENPFVPNSPVCNDTNTRVPDDEPPTVIFKPVPSDESVLNEESTVTIMEPQYDRSENPFVPNSPVCNHTNSRVPDDRQVPSDGKLPVSDEPVLNEESTVTIMEPQFTSGEHVLVQHGNTLLPAVVDEWPWVKFYTKSKKNTWHMNTIRHWILASDIRQTIASPDMVKVGRTRVLYVFEKLPG